MTTRPEPPSGPALLRRARLAVGLPLPAALGVALLDDADPAAGAVLAVSGLVDGGAGAAHAGALAVLLEAAGYLAVAPSLRADEHAVTHSSATTLVRAAGVGETVIARGALDRRTRRLAFVTVTATVGEDVVARAALVKSVVARPAEPHIGNSSGSA